MPRREITKDEIDQILLRIYQAAESNRHVIPESVMSDIEQNLKTIYMDGNW